MSPKYRQRGYMEDYDEPRRRRTESDDDRGSFLSPFKVVNCPECQFRNELFSDVKDESVCERCGASLRCCRACVFHAPGKRFDCIVEVEAEVAGKKARNDCPRYSARYSREAARPISPEDARKALEKLFKM